MSGWTKTHRKIEDSSSWLAAPNGAARLLMLYLPMVARWQSAPAKVWWSGKTIDLKRGQLIATVSQLMKVTQATRQQVRSAMARLIDTGYITNEQPTTNQDGAVITVCNYELYQSENNEVTNEQPTHNQRATNGQPTAPVRSANTNEPQAPKKLRSKEVRSKTTTTPSAELTERDLLNEPLKPEKKTDPRIEQVWEHYLAVRKENGIPAGGGLKLSDYRRKMIKDALKNYTIEQVKQAISGCYKRGSYWYDGGYHLIKYALRRKRNGEQMIETHTENGNGKQQPKAGRLPPSGKKQVWLD